MFPTPNPRNGLILSPVRQVTILHETEIARVAQWLELRAYSVTRLGCAVIGIVRRDTKKRDCRGFKPHLEHFLFLFSDLAIFRTANFFFTFVIKYRAEISDDRGNRLRSTWMKKR